MLSAGLSPCSIEKDLYSREAKVVGAVWGTEFIQLLAMLSILHQDDLKNRINCTRMI